MSATCAGRRRRPASLASSTPFAASATSSASPPGSAPVADAGFSNSFAALYPAFRQRRPAEPIMRGLGFAERGLVGAQRKVNATRGVDGGSPPRRGRGLGMRRIVSIAVVGFIAAVAAGVTPSGATLPVVTRTLDGSGNNVLHA